MKTLIPTLIALTIFTAAKAQEGSYASLSGDRMPTEIKASTAPASQPYIKIVGRKDQKVLLTWAPFKGAVSRYILERSFDGRNFDMAGMLLTSDDWNNEPDYYFTDFLRNAYPAQIFYRLRVVGQDGSVIFTPVTILNAAPMAQ